LDSNQNIIYEGEVEILANYRAFILFVMPAEQGVIVTGVPDLSGPPPSNIIRVRFIHLAPDLPKVYLEVASGEDINQEIAYGEISGTADVLGGDVIFSLLDLSIRQTIKVFLTEALQGGQSYEILILP